ncbi:short chain dehydrogenase family protein [Synechococcus sp. A18-46.1]|nr:short chain dehydrogenase family protein [Synechococcus sp. A18-46.1]
MHQSFDLSGHTALITGAAGLLGCEHASALLSSGATVILTDVNHTALESTKSRLIEAHNSSNVLTCSMDVTDKASIENVFEYIAKLGIYVDILVNNAAIDPKVRSDQGMANQSRFEHFPISQWCSQLDVGLKGAFLCSQIFGYAMSQSSKGGVILNIASDLSVISPDQRLYKIDQLPDDQQPVKPVTYSVIKTGLIGLTRYLATYWCDKGVRCNALSPGGVYNGQNQQFVDKLTNLIPLSRMASADEYRCAVQFLCSNASAYMTGQNIVIDGGRSLW